MISRSEIVWPDHLDCPNIFPRLQSNYKRLSLASIAMVGSEGDDVERFTRFLDERTMPRATFRYMLLMAAFIMVCAQSSAPCRADEDTLGETPPEQQAAIDALKGIASNIVTNRDGTVRFVRFSKPVVTDEHLEQIKVFQQVDYLAIVTDLDQHSVD